MGKRTFAGLALLIALFSPLVARADTCSKHYMDCQKHCAGLAGDVSGRCSGGCDTKKLFCMQTGEYHNTDGKVFIVDKQ
jgi:hypothetical protein